MNENICTTIKMKINHNTKNCLGGRASGTVINAGDIHNGAVI
jgi:hypothetical protein